MVVEDGHWLWRVTWRRGVAYGVSKYGDPRQVRLVKSANGVDWKTIAQLDVPGGDETALRFLPDSTMVALSRRTSPDGNIAWIGTSKPPYNTWTWRPSGYFMNQTPH